MISEPIARGRRTLLLLVILLTTAGCGSQSAPPLDELISALDHFHANNPYCLPLPSNAVVNATEDGQTIVAVDDQLWPGSGMWNDPIWTAYLQAGLLRIATSASNKTQYTLTESGRKSFVSLPIPGRKELSGGSFCYAHGTVVDVFPVLGIAGQITVMIAYNVHLADRAAWSFEPSIQSVFPRLRYSSEVKFPQYATLLKSATGWIYAQSRSNENLEDPIVGLP